MAKKTLWLDRDLMVGPYLALCTSEAQFKAVLRELKVDRDVPYLAHDRANATAHTFEKEDNVCCVVCLGDVAGRTGIQIAALLVHEAVHIWQSHCAEIGESRPGIESEAYAIQSISQRLMEAYEGQIYG